MYIGIIQLYDLTFILTDIKGKVILAVSYEGNASSLLSILRNLEIRKLYFVAHPYENSADMIPIKEWKRGSIDFGITADDLVAIDNFFRTSGAECGYIVNAVDCFNNLTRLQSYNTVRVWNSKFAYISVFNGNLNTFKLFNSLHSLLDAYGTKGVLSNEGSILDTTKIRAIHPELVEVKKSELILLGTLLNAINAEHYLVLPLLEDIPNIQVENKIDEESPVVKYPAIEHKTERDEEVQETESNQPLPEPKNSNVQQRPPVKRKKIKKRGHSKILVAVIFMLSMAIGSAIGTRSVNSHITALAEEATLISSEIDLAQESAAFYANQIKVLTGERTETYKVFSEVKNISVNGMLYSFSLKGDSISLVYYLLDDTSIDTLTSTLGASYTVQSVTKTDILTVQNKAVNVYTITLSFV